MKKYLGFLLPFFVLILFVASCTAMYGGFTGNKVGEYTKTANPPPEPIKTVPEVNVYPEQDIFDLVEEETVKAVPAPELYCDPLDNVEASLLVESAIIENIAFRNILVDRYSAIDVLGCYEKALAIFNAKLLEISKEKESYFNVFE